MKSLILRITAAIAATAIAHAAFAGDKDYHDQNLKQHDFKGADLKYADFTDAVLDDADFTGADLRGAVFRNAKAWRAKLAGNVIEFPGFEQELTDQVMQNYNSTFLSGETERKERDCGVLSFHNADMRNTIIAGNAVGVDFRGADLRGADLSLAIGLDQARLTGAKYDAKTKWPLEPAKTGAVLAPDDDTEGNGKPAAQSTAKPAR